MQTRRIIDVIGDLVDPYTEYGKYLEYAKSTDLEVVVSNTTEAGIALDATDTDFSVCPKSFPGKLLAFLKARYDHFSGDAARGLAIVPCELIDHNGDELKRVLTELAKINGMDAAFIDWMNTANHFTSTLVDRIVPGYPKDNAAAICEEEGYNDTCIVKGEVFHLWVLQKEQFVQEKLPADKSGLNVIFADDITPYKQRKVKILNGSHTAMMPVAYLSGIDTVREAVTDEYVGRFVSELADKEIKPTIDLPEDEMLWTGSETRSSVMSSSLSLSTPPRSSAPAFSPPTTTTAQSSASLRSISCSLSRHLSCSSAASAGMRTSR